MNASEIIAAFNAAFEAIPQLGDRYLSSWPIEMSRLRINSRGVMAEITQDPLCLTADCPGAWAGRYDILVRVPTSSGRVAAGRVGNAATEAFPRGRVLAVYEVDTGTSNSVQIDLSEQLPAQADADWVEIPISIHWSATSV